MPFEKGAKSCIATYLNVLHSLPIPELHHYTVSDVQSAPSRLKSQKNVPSLKRWFKPTYRRKHQSSTVLDIFMVLQQLPLDSPHKRPSNVENTHTHIYIYIYMTRHDHALEYQWKVKTYMPVINPFYHGYRRWNIIEKTGWRISDFITFRHVSPSWFGAVI